MKQCSKCKETKPFSDFHKNKTKKDGCQSHCKQCVVSPSSYKRQELGKQGLKMCQKCKETKPFSDFHKDKTRKDGCRSRCKQCLYPSYYKKQELRKQGLKVCPKCKETKPFSDFHKSETTKDGCQCYCKQCVSNWSASSPTNIYSTYKSGAKYRNYDFEITYSHFMSFWQKPSYYCGT